MTAHRWKPSLKAVAARRKEVDRKPTFTTDIPPFGLVMCLKENHKDFKVGRVYPFEVVAYGPSPDNPDHIIRTILVEDPPCVSWKFHNQDDAFRKYFYIL